MYSRTIDGRDVEFGVSGKLWHGVLVMYDRASDSLWTQLDGRAIDGPRTGAELEHVPSTFTTWAAWKTAHPDTLVLRKDARAERLERSHYADYFADPDRLFFPHLDEGLGDEIAPKEVVFGLEIGDATLAVPERLLTTDGELAVEIGGTPVTLRRHPETGAVTATRRDGTPVRVDRAYWYAWKRSHSASRALPSPDRPATKDADAEPDDG